MLWHQFAIRLGLALILGAFIGAERQWRQRMAGLRTNALVAAGAGMFVMLSALAARPDDSFRIAGQVCLGNRLPGSWRNPTKRAEHHRVEHRGDIVVLGGHRNACGLWHVRIRDHRRCGCHRDEYLLSPYR